MKKELRKYASPAKAEILRRFFKTGPGEYGEGDIFIGVKVPEIRQVAKLFADLPLTRTIELLHSPVHEERLLTLLILMRKYDQGDAVAKKKIVKIYLKNTRYTNNWDLVDVSAPKILGHWLLSSTDGYRDLLDRLARSRNLWERRIAIVATFAFIRDNKFTDTLRIADMLLSDREDLLHKAVGWMLREVGKRDQRTLEDFLITRHKTMPRTMLRYAIERFPEKKRKAYLQGAV